MEIPLLRLPYDAQWMILNDWVIKDRFILSTISIRSRDLVKRCQKRQKFVVTFRNNTPTDIQSPGQNGMRLDVNSLWNVDIYDFLRTWNFRHSQLDNNDLTAIVLEHFSYIFNNPDIIFYFSMQYSRNPSLLEQIKRLKLTLKEVNLCNCSSEICCYLLQWCHEAKIINLLGLSSAKDLGNQLKPFSADSILIQMRTQFTVDQFIRLFMNCRSVQLCQVFNEDDLIKLLSAWKEGSKLECIRVNYCKAISGPTFMEELAGEMVHVRISEREVTESGMMIFSNTGTRALIYKIPVSVVILTTNFQQ